MTNLSFFNIFVNKQLMTFLLIFVQRADGTSFIIISIIPTFLGCDEEKLFFSLWSLYTLKLHA